MTSYTTNENFDRNVLSVVCFAGLLRIALEFERGKVFLEGFDGYLDLGYGVLFLAALIAILANSSYRTIKFTFYIPLVILLCLTLFDRQGISGSSEINIYVALIVIVLTMQNPDSRRFSLALFIGVVTTLIMVEQRYQFLNEGFEYSRSVFNWIFMATGSLTLIYYAKGLFDRRRVSLEELRMELSEKYKVLEKNSVSLRQQTEELNKLTDSLEKKVEERTAKLNQQKKAMQEYLDLTLKELQIEYEGFTSETRKIASIKADPISDMIIKSEIKLKEEIDSLLQKLDTEG